jgi:hypothetical protein
VLGFGHLFGYQVTTVGHSAHRAEVLSHEGPPS